VAHKGEFQLKSQLEFQFQKFNLENFNLKIQVENQYQNDGVVPLEEFYEWIMRSFPIKDTGSNENVIAEKGLRDFFCRYFGYFLIFSATICGNKPGVMLKDVKLFLKLFGPIKKFKEKIYNVYREP
jgi:hypothetical protein